MAIQECVDALQGPMCRNVEDRVPHVDDRVFLGKVANADSCMNLEARPPKMACLQKLAGNAEKQLLHGDHRIEQGNPDAEVLLPGASASASNGSVDFARFEGSPTNVLDGKCMFRKFLARCLNSCRLFPERSHAMVAMQELLLRIASQLLKARHFGRPHL